MLPFSHFHVRGPCVLIHHPVVSLCGADNLRRLGRIQRCPRESPITEPLQEPAPEGEAPAPPRAFNGPARPGRPPPLLAALGGRRGPGPGGAVTEGEAEQVSYRSEGCPLPISVLFDVKMTVLRLGALRTSDTGMLEGTRSARQREGAKTLHRSELPVESPQVWRVSAGCPRNIIFL